MPTLNRSDDLEFVKLDVLGLAKALHGARATISTFRPRHRAPSSVSDIIAIQPSLQEIADGYDFFLDDVMVAAREPCSSRGLTPHDREVGPMVIHPRSSHRPRPTWAGPKARKGVRM